MKYGVFTVILPELDLDETIEAVAEAGYDGIEWRCRRIPPDRRNEPFSYWGNVRNDMTPERVVKEGPEIARRCEDAGLEVFALATYCSSGDREEVKLAAEAAAAIGAPVFRVWGPAWNRSVSFEDLRRRALDDYAAAVEIAASFGVSVVVETHMGCITCSPSLCRDLLSGFPPQGIGVILDPGNMVSEGFEMLHFSVDMLGDYLRYVHAKNTGWRIKKEAEGGFTEWETYSLPVHEGIVDWVEVFEALLRHGYDGWVSLEDFSPLGWREKLTLNLEYLKLAESKASERIGGEEG